LNCVRFGTAAAGHLIEERIRAAIADYGERNAIEKNNTARAQGCVGKTLALIERKNRSNAKWMVRI
jgi:hypothetical protein